MNKKTKLRICFMLFILCSFLLGSTVSAAPAKVNKLKASTSGTTIKLSWSKVSGASGYEVYSVNKTTGALKRLKKTSGTSVKITKCSYNTTYCFKVRAYNKKKEYGPYSNQVSAKPTIAKPATPKYFRLEYTGDCTASFRWSKNTSGAKGFVIEYYDSSTKNYKVLKTITSSKTYKVTVRNLKDGATYKVRIRSYKTAGGTKVYSNPSSVLTVKIAAKPTNLSAVRCPYYVAKTKSATTCTNTNTKKKISLKKGTKVYVTTKTGTTVKGVLGDGTPIKISRSVLTYTGLDSSSANDYSKAQKEQFVNFKQLKSSSKYLIWISEYKLKVNVFSGSQGKWKLQQAFPCCIGAWKTRTVSGFRTILKKVPNGQYGGPVIYFSPGDGSSAEPEGCAFHNQVDKNMSKAISHGCIRMVRSNLQWLYDHCPVGTTVYIY